jgi:integrase
MREGLLDNNVVVGTNRQLERSRERVLSDTELKIIWDALGPDDYSAVVRLLMLTGQRASEIGGLRWSEIVDGEIRLPATRTKNSRPHVVPLAPAAQLILSGRPRDDEFVFGRASGQPLGGWGACKAALDLRISARGAKLEHWVHHDLRRSMATRMAELGTAPHVIEAVLNHVSGHKAGIGGVYNKSQYPEQKRITLAKWAEHVTTLGGERAATVVQFRGA